MTLRDHICQRCGQVRKFTAATSFHGFYCLECLQLERTESNVATIQIRRAIIEDKKRLEKINREVMRD